MITKHRTKN